MLHITAVILAGGQGKRMGSIDKGLLEISGKPLIQYVIERVQPQVHDIIVNARQGSDAYHRFGFPVVHDLADTQQGPLHGISSVLHQTKIDHLLCLPCDVPNFPNNLVEKLIENFADPNIDICMAHDGRRIQPLLSLMKSSFVNHIDACLARNCFGVEKCFTSANYSIAKFNEATDAFLNLNSPQHVEIFTHKLQQHGR